MGLLSSVIKNASSIINSPVVKAAVSNPTSTSRTKSSTTPSVVPPSKFTRMTADDVLRMGLKKGGKVKASSASKRADGIAVKGKTRGRIV